MLFLNISELICEVTINTNLYQTEISKSQKLFKKEVRSVGTKIKKTYLFQSLYLEGSIALPQGIYHNFEQLLLCINKS